MADFSQSLDFLKHLIQSSSMKFSKYVIFNYFFLITCFSDEIDRFWRTCIANGFDVHKEPRKMCMSWLVDLLENKIACNTGFTSEGTRFLYEERVLALDCKMVDSSSFHLFKTLFLRQNLGDMKQETFFEESFVGLDFLWNLALHCIEEDARKSASFLLVSIYNMLEKQDSNHSFEIFMSKYFSFLRSFLAERNEEAIFHCLDLLENFLEVIRQPKKEMKSFDDFDSYICLKVSVVKKDPFDFEILKLSDVLQLKAQIADQLKTNVSLLRYFWKQTELSDDTLKLSELGMHSGDQILVAYKSAKPILEVLKGTLSDQSKYCSSENLKHNSLPGYARQEAFALNDDYFDCMFSLFSTNNNSMVHRSWKLLSSLPSNDSVRAKVSLQGIKSIDQMHWNAVFDKKCIFRTLYMIQVCNFFADGGTCLSVFIS
jgi:hypothetical protein